MRDIWREFLGFVSHLTGNSLENHLVRKNHVANNYHEVIHAQVLSDKNSEKAREDIKYEIKPDLCMFSPN